MVKNMQMKADFCTYQKMFCEVMLWMMQSQHNLASLKHMMAAYLSLWM